MKKDLWADFHSQSCKYTFAQMNSETQEHPSQTTQSHNCQCDATEALSWLKLDHNFL